MTVGRPSTQDRITGALGAIALPGLLGYALLSGLSMNFPAAVDEGLKLFDVLPRPAAPPPPETTMPHRVRSKRPEGAAAPPNIRSKLTELVAPPPIVPLIIPPPVIAAKVAGPGADATAGAAERPGPGTGAGGVGNGTGSGRYGDGDGAGGDDTPPRWRSGRLRDSDFPRAAADAGIGGTVAVRYTVGIDGRVTRCRVTGSSGSTELDDITCRLIEQRFRFAPSRDADGRPVPSVIVENHSWINGLDE